MDRTGLLKLVDAMLAELSGELSVEDLDDGWSDPAREGMWKFFGQLREDVMAQRDLLSMPQYRSILRGLDHWGVSRGRLFREAGLIGMAIRNLK